MKSQFLEEFEKILENIPPPKWYSLEDRLEKLRIDEVARSRISGMEYKKLWEDDSEYIHSYFKMIELDDLVGINGDTQSNNWIECLSFLRKQNIFDKFQSKEQFIKYLSSCNAECDDLPRVIEHEAKYYVNGNGRHRLTIAKCLNIKEAPVIVYSRMNADKA